MAAQQPLTLLVQVQVLIALPNTNLVEIGRLLVSKEYTLYLLRISSVVER